MEMTQEELKAKLDAHELWLETRWSDEVKGEQLSLARADLTDADLTCANLARADLTCANLGGANLARADFTAANLTCANLGCANLTDADLTCANLARADLTDADLTCANLARADLTCANLGGANLGGANLDYSAWPLKCSSLNVKIDKRLAAQLVYHTMRAMLSCNDDADVAAVLSRPECVALANQFHHVKECGMLKVLGSESEAARGKEGGVK